MSRKSPQEIAERLHRLFKQPRQLWLLGAGISKEAGIPLMRKLTTLVKQEINEKVTFENDDNTPPPAGVYESIQEELHENAHVEDVLDQVGSLIEVANRKRADQIELDGSTWSHDQLRALHSGILSAIRYIVRNGSDPSQEEGNYETWATHESAISIDHHRRFVEQLFRNRTDTGDPVRFFTTNYDTLLEDALSICRKSTYDGFTGGATAFWNPRKNDSLSDSSTHHDAHVYKLHGSIDWVKDGDAVLRTRHHPDYHQGGKNLLIYPQATKYDLMQKSPFSSIFKKFRDELFSPRDGVLIVCGYSFKDEHINNDIKRALNSEKSNLTLLAFAREEYSDKDGKYHLPDALSDWLNPNDKSGDFEDQVIVATNKGLYRGESDSPLENEFTPQEEFDITVDWWKFQGLSDFIEHGTPNIER